MKTTYLIVATFQDYSVIEMEIKVEHLADALCLTRGYMATTDSRRVTLRTKEHEVLAEYIKQ